MLRLTKYGTVLNTETQDGFKEMGIKSFLRKLGTKIDSSEYSINHFGDNDYFDVTFEGKNYKLSIDEEAMNNYKLGLFNNLTKQIKDLIKIQKQLNLKAEVAKTTNEERNRIINNAIQGNIQNEKEQKIYLDYLKKENRPSLKNRKQYLSNMKRDFRKTSRETIKFMSLYIPKKLFNDNYVSVNMLFLLFIGAAIGFFSFATSYVVKDPTIFGVSAGLAILPTAANLTFMLAAQIKNRILRLSKYIEERKRKKEHFELVKSYNFGKKIPEDFELELEKELSIEEKRTLKDSAVDLEFLKLVKLAQGLDDKADVIGKIETLFTEYKNIIETEHENDDLKLIKLRLSSGIVEKIGDLTIEVQKKLIKEKEQDRQIAALKLLSERIKTLNPESKLLKTEEVKEEVVEKNTYSYSLGNASAQAQKY